MAEQSTEKKKVAEKRRLLAASMWASFNYADRNARYQQFLRAGRSRLKHVIEGILLYDQVVVPTDDFMSLTILVGTLGEKVVYDMLDSGCLRFVRFQHALAYVGNGGGLLAYRAQSAEGEPRSFCAPAADSILWALEGLAGGVVDPELPRLVARCTDEIDIWAISESIRDETYKDVLNSPDLCKWFGIHNTNLSQLAGIEPDGVRCYGGPDASWTGDEIDAVLGLAAANMELGAADAMSCVDASTASPVGHLLKAKAGRVLGGSSAAAGFAELCEVASLPDIAEEVIEKRVSLSKLIKMRRSRQAEQFRIWFHANCRTDPVGVAKEYVALLRHVPLVGSLPVRVLRFIATNALGLIPGVGVLVGAADSFLVDRCFSGNSPKFFIENMRQFRNIG